MRTLPVVLVGVLSAATVAHAEKVGIVVAGEATLQPQLTSQIERWLHDRGRTVVPGALEPDAVNTLIDCFVLEDLACARGVVDARSRAHAIVFARVEHSNNRLDGTRDISVTGWWFQKDHELLAERRVCKGCTEQTLVQTVDEMMYALVHQPPVGTTSPVPVPAAATAPTTATALPTAPSATPSEAPSSRVLPYSLVGVGGLALLGGLAMIAVDEDPTPTGAQAPTFRDTATAGTVMAIGGAAVLGVGMYLLLTDKPGSRPVAAVSRDGAVVGWTGRF